MGINTSDRVRVRPLQHRGFWATVCLLGLCLVVSGMPAGSPVYAEPMSLLAGPVTIAVVPSSFQVPAGSYITVEVWVYPNGQLVDTVDADMTFNPNHLEVVSITGDPATLDVELFSAFDNPSGSLTHSRGTFGAPVTTDFRLCSIQFRARAVTDDANLVFTDLTSAFVGGQPVETEPTDPTAEVVRPAPVGGVGYLVGPGQMMATWAVELTGIAGLILGAAAILRVRRRVV